jgi:hypothetical protein
MLCLRQSVESPEFVRVRRHFRFLPVLVVVIARGRFSGTSADCFRRPAWQIATAGDIMAHAVWHRDC